MPSSTKRCQLPQPQQPSLQRLLYLPDSSCLGPRSIRCMQQFAVFVRSQLTAVRAMRLKLRLLLALMTFCTTLAASCTNSK